MIVAIGLVPDAVGNADASPIQTPGVSWSSPQGLATEVAGSRPMRHVPIWCAEKVTYSRGLISSALSAPMKSSRSSPRVQSGALQPGADDLASAGRLVHSHQRLDALF